MLALASSRSRATSREQCQCFWYCSTMRSVIQLRARMASNLASSSAFLEVSAVAAQWILSSADVGLALLASSAIWVAASWVVMGTSFLTDISLSHPLLTI